jgi:hypothetical protein
MRSTSLHQEIRQDVREGSQPRARCLADPRSATLELSQLHYMQGGRRYLGKLLAVKWRLMFGQSCMGCTCPNQELV